MTTAAAITITGQHGQTIDLSAIDLDAGGLNGVRLVDCTDCTILLPKTITNCAEGIRVDPGCTGLWLGRPEDAGRCEIRHAPGRKATRAVDR